MLWMVTYYPYDYRLNFVLGERISYKLDCFAHSWDCSRVGLVVHILIKIVQFEERVSRLWFEMGLKEKLNIFIAGEKYKSVVKWLVTRF